MEKKLGSIVSPRACWPRKGDIIFDLAGRAKRAIEEKGLENVIDATIGALTYENGDLICMNSVFDVFKNLDNERIAAYAALAGEPKYIEAVIDACFREYKPNAHLRAVATPGGTGALKNTIFNYTEEGDTILTSDWYWSPYQTILEEYGRKLTTYPLFKEDGEYNAEGLVAGAKELAKTQERILTIINSPAHNPTGFSLDLNDWDKVLDGLKEIASKDDKKVILMVDVAYIDFAGDNGTEREFFKKFENLPENMIVVVAFSMSKSYTMYGLRCGAAICIAPTEDRAEEFMYANLHSGRASWSNVTRGAMEVMIELMENKEKQEAYMKEKEEFKQMLKRRAAAFCKSAAEVGLEILPYRDGFFVSIPCKDSKALVEELCKEDLYCVPLAKGVRFAVCAVSEEKCIKSAKMIKRVFDQNKQYV